jgi:ribonuclease BN (tRNA processing enzyme)
MAVTLPFTMTSMKITVLGGCGAWPAAGQACSGYLVEEGDFRLLIDPGYATVPRLLQRVNPEQVDAVFVTHGHPDHCADLNPLLRARTLRDSPSPALNVHALPGALDAVLALDRPGMLDGAVVVRIFDGGDRFTIGPFDVETWLLPHSVPNAGVRLTANGVVLAYTGDTGPSPGVIELAHGADLLIAESSFAEVVPKGSAGFLSSAWDIGQEAAHAGAMRLLLTHLLPGTDPAAAVEAARRSYGGRTDVASGGFEVDLARRI